MPKEELIHGTYVYFKDFEDKLTPVKVHSFDGDRAIFDGNQQYYTFDRLEGIRCTKIVLLSLGFAKTDDENILTLDKVKYNISNNILSIPFFVKPEMPSTERNVAKTYCKFVHEMHMILRALNCTEPELTLLTE